MRTRKPTFLTVVAAQCVLVYSINLTYVQICGSPAAVMSAGTTFTLKYASNNDNVFVTAGDGTLRVWELDVANRKIRPTECTLGQLKRIVKCMEVRKPFLR